MVGEGPARERRANHPGRREAQLENHKDSRASLGPLGLASLALLLAQGQEACLEAELLDPVAETQVVLELGRALSLGPGGVSVMWGETVSARGGQEPPGCCLTGLPK